MLSLSTMKGGGAKLSIAFIFFWLFILILSFWILLDFLQVYDLISGLNIIPDEVWHLLHLVIWYCVVRNLSSDYAWVNRGLRRVCLALMLWIGSTVLLVAMILNFHVKTGWPL